MVAEPAKMNDLLLSVDASPRPEHLAVYRKDKMYPSLLETYYELQLRGSEVYQINVSS
jgi:hypothetical protein